MTETLSAIVMRHGGVDPLALAIVHKGRSEGITEAELTQVATEQAKREWPDLSEAAAFTRRYAEESPRGLALRKAINVCKAGAMAYPHPFPTRV